MVETIEVKMGGLEVRRAPATLEALGIGSCVAIALYDSKHKIGGLAHIMLPDSAKAAPSGNPFKFADKAINELLARMRSLGSRKIDIEAKIVGGGNMFSSLTHESKDLGEVNVLAVKEKLKKEGIKLDAEVTGGTTGRSVTFSVDNGIVDVRVKV